jgi:NifU-like protein involved in Fe-S cluster formation
MEASQFPRLSDPTCTATHRAPLCGSMITLDIDMSGGGTIQRTGFALSACAFGQASSALFAKHAIGLNSRELSGAVAKIREWLDGGGNLPWPGFDDLAPVKPLSARHGAVLLPFEAAVKALSLVPAQ